MNGLKNIRPTLADYELVDSGNGAKLERFGDHVVARPEPQALWQPSMPADEWVRLADATFERSGSGSKNGGSSGSGSSSGGDERGQWRLKPGAPERWTMNYAHGDMRLRMRLALTGFKHVGIFPEQAANWDFIHDTLREMATGEPQKVLNLFAYTGGATLAARSAGAEVTHVDSVKQTVSWARDNASLSGLEEGIRWIVDDAPKFVAREVRRGNLYDGIILDPPAYGRGPEGEKWVLEQGLDQMLSLCAGLLKPHGFLVLNLYSMGLSALVARTAVHSRFGVPATEKFGELYFTDRAGKDLPLGVYYRFVR
jgi:23S rRNA (cytosine1962-C5)-methyltransferase